MNQPKQDEVQALVQRILNDNSAYQDIEAKLQAMPENDRAKLVAALSSENPPLLGTTPVS